MDEIKAKQQVIAKIKEATKILVTVSDNPSVDALSAAIGLTMLLDKQEKYATAIFSGETPPAIAFLEPEKTFDDTTDSLRDFIIALNKEKADHLRYKVEGEAVKIFITPYKTTIDESDLEFSQGDYNVELVIALGVDNQDHLDGALENHGQILHDAAIITVTAGEQTSDLGGIDWHDAGASSLSEMMTGLAEAMKDDKKKSLLDDSISTALLTGIVAETDRFSNQHTTSKTLTVAASLMSAGADQQLIANELQSMHEAIETSHDDEDDADDSASSTADDAGTMTIKQPKQPKDGLSISHDGESLADLDRRIRGDEEAKELVTEEVEAAQERAAKEKDARIQPAKAEVPAETATSTATAYALPDDAVEPTLGGTLNATTDQAADDARKAAENDQNKTILSHSYLGGDQETAPGSVGVNDTAPEQPVGEVHSAYALDEEPTPAAPEAAPADPAESVAVGGERVIQPLQSASDGAQTPVAPPAPEPASVAPPAQPSQPAASPADLGLPLPPPIPDFSQGLPPTPEVAIPLPPTESPAILGDILAPEAPGQTLPPIETVEPVTPPTSPAEQPPAQQAPPVQSNDPTQFQIPPQPNA
jgi:hypothetical protein